MLPKEHVDFIQNAGQILLCLLIAGYIFFCAGLSAVLLVRSILRGLQQVKSFFAEVEVRIAVKPAKKSLGKGKTYAMASRNLC